MIGRLVRLLLAWVGLLLRLLCIRLRWLAVGGWLAIGWPRLLLLRGRIGANPVRLLLYGLLLM